MMMQSDKAYFSGAEYIRRNKTTPLPPFIIGGRLALPGEFPHMVNKHLSIKLSQSSEWYKILHGMNK